MESTWMLILRLIHIIFGVFWAGASFFLVTYIAPTAAATGPEGQKFMQHLTLKTRLSVGLAVAGLLTGLSGIIMYILITDLDVDIMSGTYITVITIGGVFGIVGWFAGYALIARRTNKMKSIAEEIASAGGPPSPEQQAEMQSLAQDAAQGGRITAVLLLIAVLLMAAAQPLASLL